MKVAEKIYKTYIEDQKDQKSWFDNSLANLCSSIDLQSLKTIAICWHESDICYTRSVFIDGSSIEIRHYSTGSIVKLG